MDNILNYPTSTHVDRLVPKTAFYKHLEINTRLKMRFVEDVERIQWLYKLAPSTMNVDEGKAVHEIVVFLVTLKVEDTLDDVFLAIDRQMPRYVVFVLQYANRSRLLLNYKEWADAYNPQIQISAESETKRSIFREKDKTKRSKKESAQHSKSRNKSFVMTSVSAL